MKFNLFKKSQPKVIKDSYFGEMGVVYDKVSKKYFLDKDMDIVGIHTTIILYIESFKLKTSIIQQEAYKEIVKNFEKSLDTIKVYLIETNKVIGLNEFKRKYRIESITILQPISSDYFKWELKLLNLEDNSSRIVVEMKNQKPIKYFIKA